MGKQTRVTNIKNLYRKYSHIFEFLIIFAEITLLWAVITAQVISFNRFFGNELDVLPFARQFFNHSWLPNDWYLNLDIGYRQIFSYIQGFLVDWLGFLNGAYVGRLVAYWFLAFALIVFFRAIGLRFFLGLIVVIFFVQNQSLIAGEWIVGGVDPKTVAYGFGLMAFALFHKKKYLIGFALAGAALSFHVLVGIYALYCVILATVITERPLNQVISSLFRKSWPFLITGIFGILAIFQAIIPQDRIDANKAWKIYVELRVPHHVLPSAWQGNEWISILVLATCFFLIVFFSIRNDSTKFTTAYALASISLFVIGLTIFALDQPSLLRFYWFRYPDVMVPFLGMVTIALLLNGIANLNFADYPKIPKELNRIQGILKYGLPALFAIYALFLVSESRTYVQGKYRRGLNRDITKTQVVLEWISENTPEEAVFLIDPLLNEFYVYANRARFVSFSHPPQSASEILEWYRRLTLINGNQELSIPPDKGQMQENYANLDAKTIQQLADEYGVSFYLGSAEKQLPFTLYYQDDTFTLYQVDMPEASD